MELCRSVNFWRKTNDGFPDAVVVGLGLAFAFARLGGVRRTALMPAGEIAAARPSGLEPDGSRRISSTCRSYSKTSDPPSVPIVDG
jgi:hypothetical protein